MNKTKLTYIGLGILIGLVAAPQIRKLPLVSKIPTIP